MSMLRLFTIAISGCRIFTERLWTYHQRSVVDLCQRTVYGDVPCDQLMSYLLQMQFAEELKLLGSHACVHALCPGPVNTEFNDAGKREILALLGISARECVSYCIDEADKADYHSS